MVLSDPLIIVPARMQATRLPNKPLALIAGEAMIVHVWRKAVASGAGPVLVATDSTDIQDAIEQVGGKAVLTSAHHQSGSDRICEAAQIYDPEGLYDVIVNVQGDLPLLDPSLITTSVLPLSDHRVDIATLVSVIGSDAEADNPNVVKCVGAPVNEHRLKALYFTRARAPWGQGPLYHHIGLYAYRRRILERFVTLPASSLEQREKLEQLRALEYGFRIDAMIVDHQPSGVDTPEDLAHVRAVLEKNYD